MTFSEIKRQLVTLEKLVLDEKYTEGVNFTTLEYLKQGKFFQFVKNGKTYSEIGRNWYTPKTRYNYEKNKEEKYQRFLDSKISFFKFIDIDTPYSIENVNLVWTVFNERNVPKPFISGEYLRNGFTKTDPYHDYLYFFTDNKEWFIIDSDWKNWNDFRQHFINKEKRHNKAVELLKKRAIKKKLDEIFSYKHFLITVYSILGILVLKLFWMIF